MPPEFSDPPQREIVLDPLRFVDRGEKHTVWIVAVWHAKPLPLEP